LLAYDGNVCGACLQGFGLVKPFTCRQCLPQATAVVLYVLAVCLLLFLMKVVCHFTLADDVAAVQQPSNMPNDTPAGAVSSQVLVDTDQATQAKTTRTNTAGERWSVVQLKVSSLLRPLVLYMQYALILASVTSVELPAPLAYPLQVLAWAWSPAAPGTLSIECILPHGSSSIPVGIQRMLFYLVTPVVLLVLLLIVCSAVPAVLRNRQSLAASLKGHLLVTTIVVCFFFMPAILRSTFGWFACIPIDVPVAAPCAAGAVGSFWLHDPGQLCYQG
jgi:hypothetical protein